MKTTANTSYRLTVRKSGKNAAPWVYDFVAKRAAQFGGDIEQAADEVGYFCDLVWV